MPTTRPDLEFSERERLDALARDYRPALTRYFGKRAHQRADVDDLVQEVLLRVAVRGDGSSIEQPEAYLMRSASNVWRDHLRKKKTHAEAAHDAYDESDVTPIDDGPASLASADESLARLIAILGELTPRTRQIFVLRRVEGMRQKAVAKRLGISVSAVEKHMIKAIAHLGVRLQDRLEDL